MSIEHTFMGKDGLETRVLTKAKAIRLKCLDCSGQQPGEVVKCTCVDCPLYPFRFGNEKGLERIYDPEKDKDEPEDDEGVEEEVEEKPKPKKRKRIIREIKKG